MDVTKLLKAVEELYESGLWVCEGMPEDEQKRLWENLRDAAEIPKGTATALGVGLDGEDN